MTTYTIRTLTREISFKDVDHIHNVPQFDNGVTLEQPDWEFQTHLCFKDYDKALNKFKDLDSRYYLMSDCTHMYYEIVETFLMDSENAILEIAAGVEPRYHLSKMENHLYDYTDEYDAADMHFDGSDHLGNYWLNADTFAWWEHLAESVEFLEDEEFDYSNLNYEQIIAKAEEMGL